MGIRWAVQGLKGLFRVAGSWASGPRIWGLGLIGLGYTDTGYRVLREGFGFTIHPLKGSEREQKSQPSFPTKSPLSAV